jgi:uncharacterized Fe-S center protein
MAEKKKAAEKAQDVSTVYYADIAVTALEPNKTLPAKFGRMLKRLNLASAVEGKSVGIKMHFGGNIGFSTIPPVLVRILIQALKEAGSRSVKVMDNDPGSGIPRGYTREVLGCEVVSCFGTTGKYLYELPVGFKGLDSVSIGGEALDCDVFIDLSHVKGHGDCGFGGALKNIAMGVINGPSRAKLHRLEGGIEYDPDKCIYCKKCFEACPHDAISLDEKAKKINIFFHNCNYCQHCVMVCPSGAVVMDERKFGDFAEGMARVTDQFLRRFDPDNLLFINVLLDITVYCDCWGMTTPALVPDIGILASRDIVALEKASLDMIKTEDLLPNGLPKKRKLLERDGHLFEKIHGKNPFTMIHYLQEFYGGSLDYKIHEIR